VAPVAPVALKGADRALYLLFLAPSFHYTLVGIRLLLLLLLLLLLPF
jgi:hypothetical protein